MLKDVSNIYTQQLSAQEAYRCSCERHCKLVWICNVLERRKYGGMFVMRGMEELDGKRQRFDRHDEDEDDHERACMARDALS